MHQILRLLTVVAQLVLQVAVLPVLQSGYATATCYSMFLGWAPFPAEMDAAHRRHFRCERKSWQAIVNRLCC